MECIVCKRRLAFEQLWNTPCDFHPGPTECLGGGGSTSGKRSFQFRHQCCQAESKTSNAGPATLAPGCVKSLHMDRAVLPQWRVRSPDLLSRVLGPNMARTVLQYCCPARLNDALEQRSCCCHT